MEFPDYIILSDYSCTNPPDGSAVCSGNGKDDRGRRWFCVDVARYNNDPNEDIAVRHLTMSLSNGSVTLNLEGVGVGSQSPMPEKLNIYLTVKDYPEVQAIMTYHNGDDGEYMLRFQK